MPEIAFRLRTSDCGLRIADCGPLASGFDLLPASLSSHHITSAPTPGSTHNRRFGPMTTLSPERSMSAAFTSETAEAYLPAYVIVQNTN